MKWLVVAVVLALAGCVGALPSDPSDPCYVAPDWNVSYQDCGSQACVATCGVLPQDGSPGHRLPDGCMVTIGTSYEHEVTCVDTCQECH